MSFATCENPNRRSDLPNPTRLPRCSHHGVIRAPGYRRCAAGAARVPRRRQRERPRRPSSAQRRGRSWVAAARDGGHPDGSFKLCTGVEDAGGSALYLVADVGGESLRGQPRCPGCSDAGANHRAEGAPAWPRRRRGRNGHAVSTASTWPTASRKPCIIPASRNHRAPGKSRPLATGSHEHRGRRANSPRWRASWRWLPRESRGSGWRADAPASEDRT